MSWYHAAGALGSTLPDLIRWDRASRDKTLISSSTSAMMHAPARLNDGTIYPYGMGIGLGEYHGIRCTHHAGGVGGFVSQMRCLYDPEITIIVLANLRTTPFDKLTRAIARMVPALAEQISEPAPPPKSTLTADLNECLGTFRHEGGAILNVRRHDNSVAVEWPGMPVRQLVASSTNSFYEHDDSEVLWTFSDHRAGSWHRLTHHVPSWPSLTYQRG